MVDRVTNDAPARANFVSSSPEATREAGMRLGRACRGGELILLYGDLGAGKTCLVQGLARGLEVPEEYLVSSPTFTLHGEYPGWLVLNHLDLYRLDEPCALDSLGLEDMLDDPGAVTAVEWPELLADAGHGGRLEVRIAHAGERERELGLTAYGAGHKATLARWLDLSR